MTIIRLMEGSNYWLVLILATYCNCYDLCFGNKNCSCNEIKWSKWLARCFHDGNLEFTIIMDSEFPSHGSLRCNQSISWYNAEFRPMNLKGGPSIFGIFHCSLPHQSFGTISRRFGFEYTHLQFSSYQKLGRNLTRHHLSGLPRLRILSLVENGLTELTNDLLRDVPELMVLSLALNEITALPREIFGGLSRLKELYLDDNKIEVLDPMLFRNCTALLKLNLTENLLTSLDHRIFHGLFDLTTLYLDENPLEITLNDVFENLTALKILHISDCQFSLLPEGLFLPLESLQMLRICDNRGNLTTLPKQLFNNTTSPLDVYLKRNRFSRLSEDTFWGCAQLRGLVLTGNNFSTLPENIFRDSAELVILNLADNGLTDLPDGLFRGLTRLTHLSLRHNRIASLSTILFANLYSLRELDLSFNQLSQIHAQCFERLAQLRIARFSHNSLRSPEDGHYPFKYCVNLEKLVLDHNNFTRLSMSTWRNQVAPTLRLVDLSYNRLYDIEVRNVLPEYMRVVFDVRHNYVQQIRKPILAKFIQSAELVFMVDDNPIHCDCILFDEWLPSLTKPMKQVGQTIYVRTLTIIPGNATCASPKWMNGTRIADVDLTIFLCRPPQEADEYFRCADECDCWWRPRDQVRVVDCSSRNLTRVPDKIMEFSDDKIPSNVEKTSAAYAWRECPTELRFEANRLTEIPLFNESIYESVTSIFLSFNNLSVVSRIFLPPNLEVLRLDHCNLTTFEPAALNVIMNSTALREVNLDGNPWDCHPDTRNALLAIDNEFGQFTKYAGGEHICLDPGRIPRRGLEYQLYISYTRF